MSAITGERPELTFGMFQAGRGGGVQAVRAFKEFFGPENYDKFRRAGDNEEYIPQEIRTRIDRLVYGKIGEMFGVPINRRKKFWEDSMKLANSAVDYARSILFADQERKATLTANIAWDDGRPSSALERLTTPVRLIGEQCRYEQGRKLGLGLKSAEVIMEDENGRAATVLSEINDDLEREFFIGRKGDPKDYRTFSYHEPGTNKLVGLSNKFPDPSFEERMWVKSLDYPVRQVGLRDSAGNKVGTMPALYDQREKTREALVIKALHRSLKASTGLPNDTLIETSPYGGDRLGFRLVVMEGGYPLRDKITSNLQELVERLDYRVEPDDEVDPKNGEQDRFNARRRQIHMPGLKTPIEAIVQSVEDYISQAYEVGKFDKEKGMHDGPAHDLYKLYTVSFVADYLWPFKVFGIDLVEAKRASSYEYATRLGRKQRIHPSPYLEV